MQPPEKFYDYNFQSETNDPLKQTYIGVSQFGRKYVFPAEYDIFIMFMPEAYNGGSEEEPTDQGFFQFKTYHSATNPQSDDTDTTWTVIDRLLSLTNEPDGTIDEVVAEQVDEDSTENAVAITDDNDLPVTKIDFETDEVVS